MIYLVKYLVRTEFAELRNLLFKVKVVTILKVLAILNFNWLKYWRFYLDILIPYRLWRREFLFAVKILIPISKFYCKIVQCNAMSIMHVKVVRQEFCMFIKFQNINIRNIPLFSLPPSLPLYVTYHCSTCLNAYTLICLFSKVAYEHILGL